MAKKLDPTIMQDWEIAAEAEKSMKPIQQLAEEFGVLTEELLPYGHYLGKLDYRKILSRLVDRPNGKYVDVTAITPTPLGEGKTTTTMGLVEGLGLLGKKVSGAIRQPSGGPTFNIKGSAAGGGLSLCVPMTEFSLGLTGDIDTITNAHNLAMVAMTARMQHEFNYGDDVLERKKLKRLNIDPYNPAIGWAIDFSAQALREIIIGIGDKMDGFMMKSGFQITVSSELMAILAVARDLKDLRSRIARMQIAWDRKGNPVTAADLEVDGAMTAIMVKAMDPTLMQTIEGQPVLVHAGPFANIAIGQSSIIADRIGLKLSEYHVTESGFGADIGFEKFWNLKCRYSGFVPDAAVIVATIRALKMHGGGPRVTPGKPLDEAYTSENVALVEKGCENLIAHIENVKKSGITPVVCINHFYMDSEKEIAAVRKAAEEAGARVALSRHWELGGEGAKDLAGAVVEACEEKSDFRFLYETSMPQKQRIELIAREIYGAEAVSYTPEADAKLRRIQDDTNLASMGTCMVKTQLSLSHDPELKGRPKGWTLPVTDVLVYQGAELIVPVAGGIKLLPGTASDPAFRRIDVDTETGKVTGLF
ncbi:formate--tetrahydrofolate ligase [Sediminispirochaeta smaragdinae]|uniref:Formate--tetrahydrofolate ligase n=1 Tax=Sediminispirochaeta smaragdinae (strain DSM 11293 / JCM 15392 / SEBR 4228) TaxID=573413 RepID=E1R9A0_SEDSS|nr:formate--tetrahydrofolate ligase [Sediminispirochaeta smaragdinae]ADK83069.1 Formate--tetrahydrofolate ligase [Sediminispirochaeta smaragdinae DSM 11293]